MDYFGGALLTVTLILLCLAVAHDGLFELSSWTPWWLLAGCSLGIVALVVVHRNAEQPLLSPILLRARAFLLANVVQLLVGVALILAMASIVIMANTVMNLPDRPVELFHRGAVAAPDDRHNPAVRDTGRPALAAVRCAHGSPSSAWG